MPIPEGTPRYAVKNDGYLRFLGAPSGYHFPVLRGDAARPVETARAFLSENRELFGMTSPDVAFSVMRERVRNGGHHVRLQQTYRGVPVLAGEVITLIDSEGGIQSVVSDLLTDTAMLDNGTVSVRAGISAEGALDAIRGQLEREAPGARVTLTTPTLMIYAPSVVGLEGDVRLVWHSRSASDDVPELSADIYLDAQLGTIAQRFARYYEARDRQISDANNTDTVPGTLERSEGDPVSGIGDVDDAYDFLGDTYDYYAAQHGRDAIDNSGSTIPATVRYCTATSCPWGNASWNGSLIKFGDGWATDDIAAHEYTHGVTGDESGLVYANTSGAINESFSDIWGEFVDLGNGAGDDSPAVRWIVGEDLSGGGLRDMADPPRGSDPDRVGSPFYIPAVAAPDQGNDYGGVHTNSGVVNKLTYLLTDGDAFNGRTIHGIGIPRVANLFYEVQVNFLTSSPEWIDFGLATAQAAINLGWGEADLHNLLCALVAVEILDDADPPTVTLSDAEPTFNPPNPWTQVGVVIETMTVKAESTSNLTNVHFMGEALQCADVPCETDHLKKLDEDWIEFIPPHVAYIPGGDSVEVEVKFTIPIGQAACVYSGKLWVIGDVDGYCQDQVAVDVDVDLEVLPEVDMDIDDNHANVSENVMHLKGAKDTTVWGKFTVVNPNSEVKNIDLVDGPGNIRIDPVDISVTDLVKVGDPAVWIPSTSVDLDFLNILSNGEAQDVAVGVHVPDGIPVNAFYRGTVLVSYESCLGGDTVSDSFTLEVEVLPTQGSLDIIQTGIAGDFCPDDPWTMMGQVMLSFDVHANGDHRNIRVASGGLKHETLDTKLDDFNFFPEEIAFLAAGETRTINVITRIPIGQNSGEYSDYFRVVSENAGEDSVQANITICPIYDLDIKDGDANVDGNVMIIQAYSRANQTGQHWALRGFDIGLPSNLDTNDDVYDGPGNTKISCVKCEFAEWSPLWHEDDPSHNLHSNKFFTGVGTVMGETETNWSSGIFKRLTVGLFVPEMKAGVNLPGTYKGRLDCWAIGMGGETDTVAHDFFDIEVKLARVVGGTISADDDAEANFGGYPSALGAEIYWGSFADLGRDGPVNLYRQGPGDAGFVKLNPMPLSQASKYVDRDVMPGETYVYRLGVQGRGEEFVIGPLTIGGTPKTSLLSQNAPNPFGDQTTIAYELAEAGRVSLQVFDISGRQIRVLENREQPAGFYTVIWDRRDDAGRQASSGIYFYRLTTAGFTATKKMMVIR